MGAAQRCARPWSAASAVLLCLVACSQLSHTAQAAVLAVDLGSEFLKIAIVKPGRTPISIVLNEMSKRKTSSQVAFVNGERLLGEEAAVLQPRYPDRVYSQLRDFLGVQAADPAVAALLAAQHLPYKVAPAPERGTVAFVPAKGEEYTIEEAVASLLHYARNLGIAAADGAPVVDIVITVPAWFGQVQRQAVLDAASLVGLNVLSLVNSHAAAALQYGIERNFANTTEHVILYDMGSSSTEVALVKYSSFEVKEAGRMVTHSQFETLDVAWDTTLGSASLDAALIEHFGAEFDEAHPLPGGGSVLGQPKAVAKLRKQAKRVKQVLSANSEAPLIIEELHAGTDFRSRISRADFESLAGGFFARAAVPLATLLARNPEAARNLSAVELLGGGTRVPAVQAALSNALGGRVLDRHLDADEAVVLGAALFAANLSTTFRLRKFGMSDGVTHPVAFQLEQTPGAAQNEDGTAFAPKALLPFGKRLPAKRVVHLPNVTADPVKLRLLQGPSRPDAKPEDATTLLAAFELTGVNAVAEKHGDTGKISAHFKADSSGIVSFDKAEVILERTELVNVTVPVPTNTTGNGTNGTGGNGTGPGGKPADAKAAKAAEKAASAAKKAAEKAEKAAKKAGKGAKQGGENGTTSNGTEAVNGTAPEPPATMVVQRERRRTIRLPLAVGGHGFLLPGLSDAQRKVLRERMAARQAADDAKRAAAHAKNDLESYIISTRGGLQDDEAVAAVTTGTQRESFLAALNDAEEWLYEGGEDAPAPDHQSRLAKLRAVGDPVAFRKAEVPRRSALAAKAAKFGELAAAALEAWPKSKPWLNETETADFAQQVKDFQKFFAGQQAAQAKKAAHEEPAFKSADVSMRLDAVRKAFAKLKNQRKPKPPPATPAAAANGTANGTAGNGTADGAEPAAGDKEMDGEGEKAGSSNGSSKEEKDQSWEELMKGMEPDGRARMEEMLKKLRTDGGGGGLNFGANGGPKFMNMDDLLKRAKPTESGGSSGDGDGSSEGGDFADGLEDHDEL